MKNWCAITVGFAGSTLIHDLGHEDAHAIYQAGEGAVLTGYLFGMPAWFAPLQVTE
jgi:hypothetical protein